MQHTHRSTVVATAMLFGLLASGHATVAHAQNGERITAHVVKSTASPGPSTAHLIIQIDQWTSDDEVVRLAGILKDKGPQALQEALVDLDYGWIRVGSSLGYPIAVARSIPNPDGGRTVRVVTDRPLSFFEITRGTRSRDYPLSVIEIKFDAEGKGEGTLAAAVKAHFKGPQLVIESYGIQPSRIVQARVR